MQAHVHLAPGHRGPWDGYYSCRGQCYIAVAVKCTLYSPYMRMARIASMDLVIVTSCRYVLVGGWSAAMVDTSQLYHD